MTLGDKPVARVPRPLSAKASAEAFFGSAQATTARKDSEEPRGKQGFASMAPDKQRAIASKGGQAVEAADRPFSKSLKLASEAGRKGGIASAAARTLRLQGPG
jgi:general stress protein YciG